MRCFLAKVMGREERDRDVRVGDREGGGARAWLGKWTRKGVKSHKIQVQLPRHQKSTEMCMYIAMKMKQTIHGQILLLLMSVQKSRPKGSL